MTVLRFDLLVGVTGGAHTERKGSVTEVANRRYEVNYRVTVDSIYDGPLSIMNSPLCPKLASPYALGTETDALATCIELDIRRGEWPFLWYCTAKYDSGRLVDKFFDNPFNIPPEINWTGSEFMRPLVRDGSGVPVVNSARDPFDPPMEYDDPRPVLVITRNEPSYSSAQAQTYRNAVNTDVFANAQPGCAKMHNITGQKVYDFGFTYYKVTYEIHFKWDSFAWFVLDIGYKNKMRQMYRDLLTGVPLSNPTPMNGSGDRRDLAYAELNGGVAVGDKQIQVVTKTAPYPANPQAAAVVASNGAPFWPPLARGGTAKNPAPAGTTLIPPPDAEFEIRVGNEVMQVYTAFPGGANVYAWNVNRAYGGTTEAAHNANDPVTLEPYFLKFAPNKSAPFKPLNFPVIP